MCFQYECIGSVFAVLVYISDVPSVPTTSGVKEEKWAGIGDKNRAFVFEIF